jgi:AmmeMemoRadiSam system protein B/AmmeMemoRadiSam system protein A
MVAVRPPAVAGAFYPGDGAALRAVVAALLTGAEKADASAADPVGARAEAPESGLPKALIAPHAGYVYSGPVAATAYARLAAARDAIRRVVLIGPAHRVPVRGLAVSSASAFATPLGQVPVDRAAVESLLSLPFVSVLDAAHAVEHSLEVHLPFLQQQLASFSIVPVVAGEASAEQVAQALELLWGGPETLVVVSSDLSHYEDYETARRMDAATSRAIEELRPEAIGFEDACGRVPVSGLLTLARRRGLVCRTVDLRNSGDTAGPKDRVVGYGAYLFFPGGADGRLPETHGRTLLEVAKASVEHGLREGQALRVAAGEFAASLRAPGASFVTLKIDGDLRGCVGSPEAWRPLVEDVAENAFSAAFGDSRFPPLDLEEWPHVDVSISVLTPPIEIAFASEEELLALLRPGIDGLILTEGPRRGLFLPQVWDSLPEPRAFLAHLKRKAGLSPNHWSPTLKAFRFRALSIPASGEPEAG